MNNNPIGFFDSGVGGLTIWSDVHKLLPAESCIYLADSLNAPYGEKSTDQIAALSVKNTRILLDRGVKLIVVACNTATTNAISQLRNEFDIPFVGIEPATKPAAIQTKSGKIGVLATKGTFTSELFLNTSKKYSGDVEIIETIGTGLVQIIETGDLENSRELLNQYLMPMVERGVDNIVLGCTHYPFLTSIIKEIVPENVHVIDSGNAVARRVHFILSENNMLSKNPLPTYEFITNGDHNVFNRFVDSVCSAEKRTKSRHF